MNERLAWARALFAGFQELYERHVGTSTTWKVQAIGEDEARDAGLSIREAEIGLGILLQKRLVKAEAAGNQYLALTSIGEEACLHPELLDEFLAPRARHAPMVKSTTINAGTMHNTLVGDHNVQNITYQTRLTELAQKIDSDPDMPPEKKSIAKLALAKLVEVLVPAVVSTGAETLAKLVR